MTKVYTKESLKLKFGKRNNKSLAYKRKKENQIYMSLIKDAYALALN